MTATNPRATTPPPTTPREPAREVADAARATGAETAETGGEAAGETIGETSWETGPAAAVAALPSTVADSAATAPAAAVLAIDGGNSKTDVALVAADGTVLATARGPGSCPQNVGLDRCLEILTELVTTVTRAARLPAAAHAHARDASGALPHHDLQAPHGLQGQGGGGRPGPVAAHTAAYLAGADLPQEQARLQRAVHDRGWSRTTEVANDTFALLRAGTTAPWGVAVVCGSGINCVGRAPDGRVARFPALGRISGDWGGGHDLGTEALWWAVRGEDGRGPKTALQQTVPAHFGLGSVAEVTEAVHVGAVPERRLGELTPVLFTTAAAGDPVARGTVRRLAAEVSGMAVVALDRLGLLGTRTDVVLGGGVLTARPPLLMEGIADGIATRAPHAVLTVTSVPPVVGAALLGLDRHGITAEVEDRLRRSLASG